MPINVPYYQKSTRGAGQQKGTAPQEAAQHGVGQSMVSLNEAPRSEESASPKVPPSEAPCSKASASI
jgi:hypothetical protein